MPRQLLEVALKDIDDDKYAVRAGLEDDAFHELVGSIRRDGILQPVFLEKCEDRFIVVAGHRRVAAARVVGLPTVPAQVGDSSSTVGWRGSFAENMFRKDLSPLEEAAALNDCIEGGLFDVDSAASACGRSRAWVEGRLEMLAWPADCQEALHREVLSCAALRHLAGIEDDAHRGLLIDYAIENGASARTCAAWYQAWKVGLMCDSPGLVVTDALDDRPAPIVPYTPCVLCGRQCKMAELSYNPVCGDCGPVLLQVARQIRADGDGGGVGAGG